VDVLQSTGSVPLPPYMRREAMPDDDTRYNTVFATNNGSIAAPTASLHFSEEVLARLKERGVRSTHLTLHVGAGTFLPVKSERMAEHAMHSEQVRIPREALIALREQVDRGPIIAVGTTALRSLESIYWHGVMLLQGRAKGALRIEQWEPYGHTNEELPSTAEALDAVIGSLGEATSVLSGNTSLLIAPGYDFRFATGLITNFHQPQSTLLLLVAAFVGPDWRRIYDHALGNDYRFLSYGDGSLLIRG
ncbi:MAG TPA: S-adenosylmethionine:tRNA ribosyltransferase-isomerase, partial [Flavobacteriales bacterium]|nr:S-adenosylmethionine:tRNA ribosyltransferase-isomerase [Flavobacteriales bacterium]